MESFPDDSIQHVIEGAWWETTPDRTLCVGRLVWAYVPHVDENPTTLVVEGRTDDAGNHGEARLTLTALDVRSRPPQARLPVAALPLHDGEAYLVSRGKKRPCIVVGISPEIDKSIRQGQPKWQFSRTLSVLPGYGVEQNDKRTGFNPAFVKRVRAGEFAAYHWDRWPTSAEKQGTIFRLDQVATIGAGSRAVESSDLRLSESARTVMRERLEWLATDTLDPDSAFSIARELLLA